MSTRADQLPTDDSASRAGHGTAALVVLAVAALGRSLQIRDGLYNPMAILWLAIALVACLAAFLGPRRLAPKLTERHVILLLGLALAAQFVQLFAFRPGSQWAVEHGVRPGALFHALLAIAVLACAAGVADWRPARRIWFPVFLLAYVTIGVWIIRAVPRPYIDVYVVQNESCRALLEGRNPYSIDFPDIYSGTSHTYTPGMLAGGRTAFGYCYMPLTLLAGLPGHVLGGDYRHAYLFAMALAGAMIACMAGGRIPALAAALFLFTPRAFYFIEQGWTDAVTILFLAASVFAAIRFPRALPWCVGLLLASKQYLPLAAPLLVMLLRSGWTWRDLGSLAWKAAAVAVAVTLPLALWNLDDFIRNALLLQFRAPFRTDALSFLAYVADKGGPALPSLLGFLAFAVAMCMSLWKLPRGPGGFAAGIALSYFAFFALNKQAFCNYYFFVIGALCCALAQIAPRPPAVAGRA